MNALSKNIEIFIQSNPDNFMTQNVLCEMEWTYIHDKWFSVCLVTLYIKNNDV